MLNRHPPPPPACSSYSCGFCADQGCVLCLTPTPQHPELTMPHENILGAYVHTPQSTPTDQSVRSFLAMGGRVVCTLMLADVGAHYRQTHGMLHELAAGVWRAMDAQEPDAHWNVLLDPPERRLVVLLQGDSPEEARRATQLLLQVGNATGMITVESAAEGA